MKNKRNIVAMLALAGFLAAGSIYAAEGEHKHDPSKRLEKLTQTLSLTEDQQAQVKKIMEEGREQKKEARTQNKEAWKKQDEKIQAVLTDEQKTKYKEMKEKMKEGYKKDKHR